MLIDKVQPNNINIEQAILGAMILERRAIYTALEILPFDDCFYDPKNKTIFAAIKSMYNEGVIVDIFTLTAELSKIGKLEFIGGAYFITKLTIDITSTSNITKYCLIIYELYVKREEIRIGSEMIANAYDNSTDCFNIIDSVESNLSLLALKNNLSDVSHVSDNMIQELDEIDKIINSKIELLGIDTGFNRLNFLTGGWQSPNLVLIGARSSVGKSAFALQTALNSSMSGVPSMIISMEMTARNIRRRAVSNIEDIDMMVWLNPNMIDDEIYKKIQRGYNKLSELPIFIEDNSALTFLQLKTKIRKLVREKKVGIVLIDYIQIVRLEQSLGYNREQALSNAGVELLTLSKELNITIVMFSQLNKGGRDGEPNASNIRECEALYYHSQTVAFLWKDEFENRVLSLAKNRDGEIAIGGNSLVLTFEGQHQKYRYLCDYYQIEREQINQKLIF